jgi:flagellar hook-associated protein 2
MGTITSGVGLMSGLNIDDIVSKLMAIERRPLVDLQTRVKETDTRRMAIQGLAANVLAIKAALAPLRTDLLFRATRAVSSNPNLIQATAARGAAAGTWRVRVQQLATAQELVGIGVSDPDDSLLGAGTLVFASSLSKLSQDTPLGFLNSQQGVKSGIIQITDGSGATAQIDLSASKTVRDVIDAINAAGGIRVRAEVRGDRLAIVDLSGQQTAVLTVADVGAGRAAQSLGIAGTGSGGQIVGADINTINESTSLSLLNDRNGVGIHGIDDDMQITTADGNTFRVNLSDRLNMATNLSMLNDGRGVRLGTVRVTHADGQISEVDLSGAETINDVITALGAGANVTASIVNNQLLVADKATGTGRLTIEDVSGYAAADLGIAGTAMATDPKSPPVIRGQEIFHIRTIGDVLRAINNAVGNNGSVTASLDLAGKGIVLTDHTTGSGELAVQSLGTSTAAADLGLTGPSASGTITGRRLIATMNSTLLRSLNGGQGIQQLGQIRITDRAGNASVFDLTGAQTVDDVLSILRAQPGGAQIQANLSDSGLGIVIQDSSGGSGSLTVEDITGTAAQDLKIAGQSTTDVLRGGTLYRQYVSGNTLLRDMNFGNGVAAGSFKITDSAGNYATITVNASGTTRLRDVINQINNSSDKLNVEARINETGDGIEIIDRAGGAGQMKIEDKGSTTAADLRIAGATAVGQDSIDGRASTSITLDAASSLNDLVAQLQKANNLLSAAIINDGSDVAPYRLVIAAANAGSRGALAIDTGGVVLGLETLVQAQDAVAYVGGNGQTGGVQVVSSDNQLRGVIPNVTLSLTGQGGSADVTVSKDVDALAKQMASVADKINATLSQLKDLTKYSDDANSRGILFGEYTADQLRDSLYDMIGLRVSVNGRSLSLSDLGLSLPTRTGSSRRSRTPRPDCGTASTN